MKQAAQSPRLMTMWSVGALVVTCLPCHVDAREITAAALSPSAVQAAINQATNGDVVILPNGSASWTSGVSIDNKAIHLRGASPGGVTIVHNSSGNLITIAEASAGHVEISHLHFAAGVGQDYTIVVYAGGRSVLIHDNQWTGIISGIRFTSLHGVVWANTLDTQTLSMDAANVQFISQKADGLGDESWVRASTMGALDSDGEHNLYVEDNSITHVGEGALDPDDNARMVIRHNVFDNSALASHGPDTSPIGARHVELYDNRFIFTNFGDCDGSRTMNLPYLVFVRGGTWIITNNVMPDLSSCSWGDKSGVLATVMNLQRNAGPYPCWRGGYPSPHQFGLGANGTAQVLDPAYIWNNTGSASGSTTGRFSMTDYGAGECPVPLSTVADYIHVGRDVLVDAPKPGWTKFAYPHPARSGSGSSGPATPQNLRVVGGSNH
jgi:hypothetical protein